MRSVTITTASAVDDREASKKGGYDLRRKRLMPIGAFRERDANVSSKCHPSPLGRSRHPKEDPFMSIADIAFETSDRLRERAHAVIPGGAHTYAKGDDQYPVLSPGFIARGRGSHVWDVDGNEYVEFGMGNRAVGLGHAYGPVIRAARDAMEDGANFTRPARIELECAEAFLATISGAEMVKFCKDGSDATSGAVRLARAYTGRDMIALCGDHPFFSTDDWFIGTTPVNSGIPEQVKRLTTTFRYGDLDSVRLLFDRYPDRIAALIAEASRLATSSHCRTSATRTARS